MPRLRTPVRRTGSGGAKQYATVEAVALGRATVRLSRGGRRLTNLPIHGMLPTAGDTVIVDYSSGDPYVRRLTVVQDTTENLAPADWEDDLPTDVVVDEYGGGIPAIALTACRLTTAGSYSVRIGWSNYTTIVTQGVPFDDVEYDTGNLARLNPNREAFPWYGFMGIASRGKYLVRYTIGVPVHPNITWAKAFPAVYYTDSLANFNSGGARWRFIHATGVAQAVTGSVVIMTGTSVVPLYHEEQRICLGFELWWGSTQQNGVVYVDFPQEAGKYPILEAWKIADVNPAMQGNRDWAMTYYLP
jgi:hypothetical protein